MGLYSSTNPTDWGLLDGIYIDEVSPPPSVTGVPSGIAILVGQFERGSNSLQSVGSTGQLFEQYGNNLSFSGNVALQNKKFGLLKVVRVVASGAAAATYAFPYTSTSIITFSALWKGAYGNNLTVAVAAGSTQGSKYTVHDGNANAVWPDEVYDNVLITAITATNNPFAHSNLISVVVNATTHEPTVASATSLATGSDGSVADTDYLAAINLTEVQGSGNILFLDAYNTTRKGYLKTSMANTTDKMTVLAGSNGDSASAAITDAASYRDTDGRIIYAYPWVYTTVGGINTAVQGASFYAALLSQIAPNIDPAYAANTQYFAGINSLVNQTLTRSDYINLMAAGISAYEVDSDIGIKIKSGVVTQIANSAKIMVFRRRMADFLMQSIAKFLKAFQNAPNSLANRTQVAGSITAFNRLIETDGLVPKDSEVSSGKASLIDTKSLNTDQSIAQGYFKILYKRRIYSSMRFIVLQAEIGEGVVVTEQS